MDIDKSRTELITRFLNESLTDDDVRIFIPQSRVIDRTLIPKTYRGRNEIVAYCQSRNKQWLSPVFESIQRLGQDTYSATASIKIMKMPVRISVTLTFVPDSLYIEEIVIR